jgi:hypothetical protein
MKGIRKMSKKGTIQNNVTTNNLHFANKELTTKIKLRNFT